MKYNLTEDEKKGIDDGRIGKNIFIFFLYPNTFYQAFRVGDILNCPDLYQDELVKIIPTWDNTFNQLNHEKEIARG